MVMSRDRIDEGNGWPSGCLFSFSLRDRKDGRFAVWFFGLAEITESEGESEGGMSNPLFNEDA